jgi:chorismate mutase
VTDQRVRAIRGATTVEVDTPEAIGGRVQELLGEILRRNGVDHEDVISVTFTATPDLTSAFPATAARDVGFGDIPLICATEIPVTGATPRCVRVMVLVYTELARLSVRHTYLHEAQGLRDDLPE